MKEQMTLTTKPSDSAAAPERSGQKSQLRALLPYLAALLLFGAGIMALYRLLEPVDIQAVAHQIMTTPWHVIGAAMVATLAGYGCLACYDWSALRHIGKRLPPPVALMGGFLAYAFGNTIGLTAVSGAAVPNIVGAQ